MSANETTSTTQSVNLGTQCLTRHGTTTNTSPNELNPQGQWYAKALPGFLQGNTITYNAIAYDQTWGGYIKDTIEPCAEQSKITPDGYEWKDLNDLFKEVVVDPNGKQYLWATSNIHDLSPMLQWYTDDALDALTSEQAYAFYYLINVESTSKATITAYPTGELRSMDTYTSAAITPAESKSYWKYPVPTSQIWFFRNSGEGINGEALMVIRDYSITTIIPASFKEAAALPVSQFTYLQNICKSLTDSSVKEAILNGQWEAIYFKFGEAGDTDDDFFTVTGIGSQKLNWHYNLKTDVWKENTKNKNMVSAFYWPQGGTDYFYQIYVEDGVGKYYKRINDTLVESGNLSSWPHLSEAFWNGFIGVWVPGTNKLGTDLLFAFNGMNFQAFKPDGTALYLNPDGTPYQIYGYWPGLAHSEVIWTGTPKGSDGVEFSGYLKTYNNKNYVTAVNGGGLGNGANVPISTYETIDNSSFEHFGVEWVNEATGQLAFITAKGNYVGAINGGGIGAGSNTNNYPLVTNATTMGAYELFKFAKLADGKYKVITANGNLWLATNGGGWGEAANTYPIHTDAGRRGGWETFTIIKQRMGTFSAALRTYDGVNYLSALDGGGLGAGANVPITTISDTPDANGQFNIIWLNEAQTSLAIMTPNGRYVGAVGGGGKGAGADKNAYPLVTNATTPDGDAVFLFELLKNGKYAIKTIDGKYLSATNGGGWGEASNNYPIHTDAGKIGGWESFGVVLTDYD